MGNHSDIDCRGFMIPTSHTTNLTQGLFFRRIIPKHSQKRRGESIKCWICENWIEVTFKWTPGVSGAAIEEPVFLHLECDDFQPELMPKNSEGVYEITRAVPN